MNLPYEWDSHWRITLEKCASNAFGRTDVVCSFRGAPLAPFQLPQNVDVVGFDALRVYIEQNVGSQIEDALNAVR